MGNSSKFLKILRGVRAKFLKILRGVRAKFFLQKSYNLLIIIELRDCFFHERKPRIEKIK